MASVSSVNQGGRLQQGQPYPPQQHVTMPPNVLYTYTLSGSSGTVANSQSVAQICQNGTPAQSPARDNMSQHPYPLPTYVSQQHDSSRPPTSSGAHAHSIQPAACYGLAPNAGSPHPPHYSHEQTSRPTAPVQVSHYGPYPSTSSDRRTSQSGYANPSCAMNPPASAQPRPAEQQSVPSAYQSGSAAPDSRPPHQPQTPASAQSCFAPHSLPTPAPNAPTGSGGGLMLTITQTSNQAARQALEPMRMAMCESLSGVHIALTNEFARMHSILLKCELQLRQVQGQCWGLQQECARLRMERDAAVKLYESLKVEQANAMSEIQKMTQNLPKLVTDHYQLKNDHATLQLEMVTLREMNVQLREKAQATAYPSWGTAPASPVERKESVTVKPEPAPAPLPLVKQEGKKEQAPGSPSDVDVESAMVIAKDLETRKRKERHTEATNTDFDQNASADPQPPSTSLLHSHTYVPPTPASPFAPPRFASVMHQPPIAAVSIASAGLDKRASSSSFQFQALAPQAPTMKVEESAHQPIFSIPELGHVDVSCELEIIDLTQGDSPMQLTVSLPPFSRRAEEEADLDHKRMLVDGSADQEQQQEQRVPNKRRRTIDGVSDSSEDEDIGMVDAARATTNTTSQNGDVEDMPPLSRTSTTQPGERRDASKPDQMVKEGVGDHSEDMLSSLSEADVDMLEAAIMQDECPPAASSSSADGSEVPAPARQAPPLHMSTSSSHASEADLSLSPFVERLAGSNLSLPSAACSINLPATVAAAPPPQPPKKQLSVAHISIIYEVQGDKLNCKACMARFRKFGTPQTIIDAKAPWSEIAGHYQQEHPASCEKLVNMSPEEIRYWKEKDHARKSLPDTSRLPDSSRKRKVPA